MGYLYPCGPNAPVSDDFAEHVARGSVNPGTDYAVKKGTPVYAVATGVVVIADPYPDGGGGRTIGIDHADGNGTDYLHLSKVAVGKNQGVQVGDYIGESGGSGYGQENYYGAHLHISIRNRHGSHFANAGNFDFDAMMKSGTAGGDATPIEPEKEEEDDMSIRGLAFHKVDDDDGVNWLYPYTVGLGGVVQWRLVTKVDGVKPSADQEINGVQAALGYGPTLLPRSEFNEIMKSLGHAVTSGV